MPAEAIDATARRIIDAEGYGEQFIHRTGHGIGLEGHEEPYLVAGNAEPLRPGMAFSIEPGIYFDGRYGARLEDIVVCGTDGPIVLNRGAARPVRRRRDLIRPGYHPRNRRARPSAIAHTRIVFGPMPTTLFRRPSDDVAPRTRLARGRRSRASTRR